MNTTQNCDKLSQFCRRVTLLSESINKGNYIMRNGRFGEDGESGGNGKSGRDRGPEGMGTYRETSRC